MADVFAELLGDDVGDDDSGEGDEDEEVQEGSGEGIEEPPPRPTREVFAEAMGDLSPELRDM